MITDAILTVFFGALELLMRVLPDMDMPDAIQGGAIAGYATTVRGWLAPFAYWMPLDFAFAVAAVILTFKIASKVFVLMRFVMSFLPL